MCLHLSQQIWIHWQYKYEYLQIQIIHHHLGEQSERLFLTLRSPVLCITNGINASAGTVILLASPKERRFSLPNSRIMIHQPSSGVRGKASEIEVTAEEIMKLRRRCNQLIAEETDHSLEQVEKDTNGDCWMSPQEAK